MMNFEERRAEIFRRSDERIKTRKQNRKRILLSCMSLVIFVSVISAVAAFPLTEELSNTSNVHTDNNSIYSANFFVEISNNQISYHEIIDDAKRATDAAEILTQYTTDSEPNDDEPTENPAESQQNNVYEIAFCSASERKVIFTLSGNILTEVDTQHKYALTDIELEEILTALGLEY